MRSSRAAENAFRPAPPKPPAKSDITTIAARAIIKAEADQRNAKTLRLRAARLAVEPVALLNAGTEKDVRPTKRTRSAAEAGPATRAAAKPRRKRTEAE